MVKLFVTFEKGSGHLRCRETLFAALRWLVEKEIVLISRRIENVSKTHRVTQPFYLDPDYQYRYPK